ncbi:MAG TPA: pantetheine-phosphate adenylyltransferase [Cycloclasticus sp.]|jgi:pantetheine-phosphate adenylyltransferase|nr:pantetheine-phosphate adenylyltransferase [Cycloclasticus sp.]
MSKKAVYPGTFDPITNGHVDIIERSAKLFDEVIVAVAKSAGKAPLFDLAERVELAQRTLAHLSNVQVYSFEGLLVDFAKQQQANIVVRGVRSIADFEYEKQMAGMNQKMFAELETVFLTPQAQWADLSSTLVRDIARCGGDVSNFVSAEVFNAISKKSS